MALLRSFYVSQPVSSFTPRSSAKCLASSIPDHVFRAVPFFIYSLRPNGSCDTPKLSVNSARLYREVFRATKTAGYAASKISLDQIPLEDLILIEKEFESPRPNGYYRRVAPRLALPGELVFVR